MSAGLYFFIRAARIRSKIQIMSENKIKGVSGCFVICDVQEEYSEHLFQILSEHFEGEYQFHLFHDLQKMRGFFKRNSAEILVIGEEYGTEITEKTDAGKKFILTGIPGEREEAENISLFRYQPAEAMIRMIRKHAGKSRMSKRKNYPKDPGTPGRSLTSQSQAGEYVSEKWGKIRIRDEPPVRGLIGIYSPVHRIGKTKFALRLGQKMASQVPVLYLNMEGYSGGSYYFQDGAEKDLGDLFYFLKQDKEDCGLKLTAMALQKGGMDYILPMKNEQDVRSVRKEEWISLLDMILEKCIYEVVLLDLGDAVHGLYDILRKCDRIYTPYIHEGAAEAKLEQYEDNLRAAGYADILRRTVKRQMGRNGRNTGKTGGAQ